MRLVFAVFLFLLTSSADAEPRIGIPVRMPPIDRVVRASGMIFSGVVLRVQRSDSGATQITFRVETAVRGVRRGQTIRISEWNGLWNSGERYVKGERVMLFLYPNSKLGLTSPVGGQTGRYSVNAAGDVLVPGSPSGTRPVPLKTFKAAIVRTVQE